MNNLNKLIAGIKSDCVNSEANNERLPEQPAPVAWRCDKEGTRGVVVTVHKTVANHWISKGWECYAAV
ncbi:hypothetical protein ACSMDC_02215 [Yersinia enterocolitica]|uniref:hypothetical protein n=1 Tax=Yersinia enterocolitica TaxID=630 RepID=UPI003F52629E